MQHIKETIPKIKNENGEKNIILGMDHNLDLLKSHIHQSTQSLLDIMSLNNMYPTITRPTRVTHTMATLIDIIFVDEQLFRSFDSCLLIEDILNHLPVLTLLKQTKLLDRIPIQFKSRCLTDDKLKVIKDNLHRVDWIGELNTNNVNLNFEQLTQIVKEKMDKVTPKNTVRILGKQRFVELWMTTGIEESSRKCKDLYKKSLMQDASPKSILLYKEYTLNTLKKIP